MILLPSNDFTTTKRFYYLVKILLSHKEFTSVTVLVSYNDFLRRKYVTTLLLRNDFTAL